MLEIPSMICICEYLLPAPAHKTECIKAQMSNTDDRAQLYNIMVINHLFKICQAMILIKLLSPGYFLQKYVIF